MVIDLTDKELAFLTGLLSQIQVNASTPEALAIVTAVQTIQAKLKMTKEEEYCGTTLTDK